jgi:hypothetical protein
MITVVLLAACAGASGPGAASAWTATPGHPAPPSFGAAVVDGGRAMWAAATKANVDARWQCQDGTADLRTTPMDVGYKLAPLGPSPDLVYAAIVVSFSSPAGTFLPGDVIDTPGAQKATVFFQARALVSPDGHASWMEANPPDTDHPRPWAYIAALEEPNPERARVDDVVEPLRGGFQQLLRSAGGGSCDVPITKPGDLDRLPYALDLDAKAIFAARAEMLRIELPRFCGTVGKAAGPWEAHVSFVEAGFKSGSNVATVRAPARITGGAPCLLPVEVVKVGSES